MRVYGALLWSMGKIFSGAEVTRIYVGSFHDEKLLRPEFKTLFDKDRDVLMNHVKKLPSLCGMRKVNEMVKRISLNIVHVCILGHLRSKMPLLYGAEATKRKLIENLQETFDEVSTMYNIDKNSFPNLDEFKADLIIRNFYGFPLTDIKVLSSLRDLLHLEIPRIVQYVAGVDDESIDKMDPDEEFEESVIPKQNENFQQVINFLVFLVLVLVLVIAMFIFDKEGWIWSRIKGVLAGWISNALKGAKLLTAVLVASKEGSIGDVTAAHVTAPADL